MLLSKKRRREETAGNDVSDKPVQFITRTKEKI